MVLERIVARTREDLARRKQERPLATLLRDASPSSRPFAAVLKRARTGFILECKHASPSEGLIRDPYHPAAIAEAYAPHADAISVLTDEPWFKGSLQHLDSVDLRKRQIEKNHIGKNGIRKFTLAPKICQRSLAIVNYVQRVLQSIVFQRLLGQPDVGRIVFYQ